MRSAAVVFVTANALGPDVFYAISSDVEPRTLTLSFSP